MPPKIKLEELFPDLPTAPPSGYHFMCQEKKNVIDEKVKEEANGVTDKPTLFKLRGQVSKTLWDEMTPKKKSSLDKKHKKEVAQYESDLEEYLGKLDDEKRCKYDQLRMEKHSSWKPEWLESEPKAPKSAYSYFQSKMRVSQSDELAEMTMIDRNRALAKKWREISGEEKNNVIKSFEEAREKHEANHKQWLEALNEHQKELYHKLKAAKNASGAKPLVDSANMARDLLAKMEAVPENEQFDIFTQNNDLVKRIQDMYIESVGIKIKKTSTRKSKWNKFMEDHKVDEIKSYLRDLSKRKKVSIKSTKDDREQEDEAETIEIPNPSSETSPPTKKSTKSWKKRMAEYGPGHPPKPKTVYVLFRAMMKQKGITDTKEVSRLYKTNNVDVQECRKKEEQAKHDYKDSVTAWLETLDDNARELYEANEMRLAKKSDPNNKSQLMIEAGTENLDYLDLQPKTPAAPHMTESSDDEDFN